MAVAVMYIQINFCCTELPVGNQKCYMRHFATASDKFKYIQEVKCKQAAELLTITTDTYF